MLYYKGDNMKYGIDKKPKLRKGVYRHYKGGLYSVIDLAWHSETKELLVIYQALYGEHEIWVRPYEMFFENVIIDGKEMPRFTFVK